MSFEERSTVEHLFRIGCLNILVATSTLGITKYKSDKFMYTILWIKLQKNIYNFTVAIGVNLPVHLVIIKSTEYYCFNGYKEYNKCQILQMIGRAGRPQYDTTATAIIMTKKSMKVR